jgi:hypothetical protein
MDNYIMPEEVIDILCEIPGNKISRKNIYVFQKLHLAVKSFFFQKYCFYNQIYVLVRGKDGSYRPLDAYMRFDKIEPWLNVYLRLYRKNKLAAKAFLSLVFIILLCGYTSPVILGEFLSIGLSYFLKTKRYLKGNRFFYISFATGCDPYKIDYSILENCQNEIVGIDEKTGELSHLGRDGTYCINLEKKIHG